MFCPSGNARNGARKTPERARINRWGDHNTRIAATDFERTGALLAAAHRLWYKRATSVRLTMSMPKLKTIIPIILANGLLWGGLLHALGGAVVALYERGYGRRSAIFLYAAPPMAALLIFVLAPSLLCYLGKREGARFLAWASIPCIVLYFLTVVIPSAAV